MVPTQIYSQSSDKKSFTRNKINTFKSDYDKLSKADKEIFNEAKYTSILQFENTIKSQSNSAYLLSPNKKALKLDGNILDFILQKNRFKIILFYNNQPQNMKSLFLKTQTIFLFFLVLC